MALVLHNPGAPPLGQFDGYTGSTLSFKGGEVCTWQAMLASSAVGADVANDGYVDEGSGLGHVVPAISFTMSSSTTAPFFLADDGTTGYGTLFGSVVGGSVGTVVTGGTALGPHTATGSGKITVWDKPGLYGVILSAVDTAATGLVPTNQSLRVGSRLGFTATGQLTLKASANDVAASTVTVGHLASFENSGSLVTTPSNLVAALNSPSGSVSSLQPNKFTQVVFWFGGSGGCTS